MCEESPLAVERALELLEGPRGNPTSWYTTSELQSLQVADEESIRRVTVHQEIAVHRPGVIFRKRRLQRAQAAVTLPGQQVPWPSSVGDLEKGFKFKWHTKSPHHNVIPSVGQRGSATLMYLDEESDDDQVDAMYRKLADGLMKHAINQAMQDGLDQNEALARSKERLCIVFRRGHSYHTRGADNDITQPADKLPLDIAGGHK